MPTWVVRQLSEHLDLLGRVRSLMPKAVSTLNETRLLKDKALAKLGILQSGQLAGRLLGCRLHGTFEPLLDLSESRRRRPSEFHARDGRKPAMARRAGKDRRHKADGRLGDPVLLRSVAETARRAECGEVGWVGGFHFIQTHAAN